MRKIVGQISGLALAAMVAAGLSTGAALAAPTGTIGPIETYDPSFGSSHRAAVINDLNAELGVSDVVYLGRLDDDSWSPNWTLLWKTGASISGTGLGGKSGSWTFVQGTTEYEVVGIVISGGSKAALYKLIQPGLNGVWNTADLTAGSSGYSSYGSSSKDKKKKKPKQPDLSHLDFYARKITDTSVPEPASLLLLGGGLVLLRRRLRKAA